MTDFLGEGQVNLDFRINHTKTGTVRKVRHIPYYTALSRFDLT